MNTTTIAALALLVAACTAQAQEPQVTLPAVEASAVQYTFDCADRRLPTQHEVGAWTGQHNFSQVYATRQRLMAEVGRSCQAPGTERVQLVLERAQAQTRVARSVAVRAPER